MLFPKSASRVPQAAAGKKRRLLAAVLLLVPALLWPASADPEDELKSAAVLGFLRYSQWAPAPGDALTVGVYGRAAFTEALVRTLTGKLVNNHPIRLVPLSLTSDPQGCQLVYVASNKASEVRQVVTSAAAARALTIGETDRFLEYGGVIYLFLIDGHIGFEVNRGALDRSGVIISSNMLRLGQMRDPDRGRALP